MAKNKLSKKEKEERKKERDLSDIRHVAKDPEGRRFLWRMLSRSGLFQTNDHIETIGLARFAERKNTGVELLNDIMSAKASLFGQMQQEHASEKKREEIENKEEEKNSDILSLE